MDGYVIEEIRDPDAPTIRPYNPFFPTVDARSLREAMQGMGSDKSKVVEILCKRTNSQVKNAFFEVEQNLEAKNFRTVSNSIQRRST